MANAFLCDEVSRNKCSIDGCGKPVKYSGLCSMHGERRRKHGDPAVGARRVRGLCTIEGCVKAHYGKGLCIAHYKRASRHGDPLGGSTPWGAVKKWLLGVALPYAGDDCLAFPFSLTQYGYGRIRADGRLLGAHVYILIQVRGEKPSPRHEACHSCGNGHLGCVNPKHLYWGTRSDNVQDAIRHGTFKAPPALRGESSKTSKYTVAQIREAVSLVRAGHTQVDAMMKTGVRQQTISRTLNGLSWKGFV